MGHGSWQKSIREQVKGLDIRTCNRWKRIAESEAKVEAALASWPDVGWGVVKMLDYLSGKFNPASPDEIGEGEDGPASTVTDVSAIGAGDAGDKDEAIAVSRREEGEPDEWRLTRPPSGSGPHTISGPLRRCHPSDPETEGRDEGQAQAALQGNLQGSHRRGGECEVEIVKVLKVIVPKGVADERVGWRS